MWSIVSWDTGYISTKTQSNTTPRIRCNIEYTMNFVYLLSIMVGSEIMMPVPESSKNPVDNL